MCEGPGTLRAEIEVGIKFVCMIGAGLFDLDTISLGVSLALYKIYLRH